MMEKSAIPYDTMSTNSVNTQSVFSKCCCCIPLRIGCFILGYLNLVINLFRTIFLVTLTLYFGIKTHGFDHIDRDLASDDQFNQIPQIQELDRSTLQAVEWILLIILGADLIWLAVNIACLVGLHKNRLGPIRTYIGFATFRLVLTVAGFFYHITTSGLEGTHVIARSIDIGLTAYFIFVYYIYSVKLEKEQAEQNLPTVTIHDVSFINPSKPEKHYLVL